MTVLFYYVAATILGLVFGSFANVVIYRVPLGKSIAYPPSHCPDCREPIRWYDNVPLLSYAILRGKCRNCTKPISPRYPAVELVSGLLFLWAAYNYGISVRAIVAALFLVTLLALALIDVDHQILPDVIVLPWVAVGLAVTVVEALLRVDILPLVSSTALSPWPSPPARALLGFIVGGGLLFVLALPWRGRGMGGGDIKLMAMIGFFLGPFVLFDLFVGVLLGSLVGIYLIALKGRSRKDLVPFGPFLVLGAYATLLWGERLIGAYLRLIGFG